MTTLLSWVLWSGLAAAQDALPEPPTCHRGLEIDVPKRAKKLEEPSADATETASEAGPEGTQRVLVTLPQMPPSRTAVRFDHLAEARSFSLTWDPFAAEPLVKAVTLPEGTWRVSLDAEPFPFGTAGNGAIDYGWRMARRGGEVCAFADEKISGVDDETTATLVSARGKDDVEYHHVTIRLVDAPSVDDAARALTTIAGGPIASAELHPRAFGVDGATLAAELLEAAGEVMLERVRTEGLAVVREQLIERVCADLVVTMGADDPTDLEAVVSEVLGQTGSIDGKLPLMPATCETLKALEVDQLAGSGDVLGRAILVDVVRLAALGVAAPIGTVLADRVANVEVIDEPHVRILLAATSMVLRSLAAGELDEADPQTLLVALARVIVDATSSADDAEGKRFLDAARTLFAAVAECQARGCDARAISDLVHHPKRAFKDVDGDDALAAWGGGERFVQAALDVLSPPRGSTARDRAAATVGLAFDLLELRASIMPEKADSGAEASRTNPVLDVRTLSLARRVATGAVRGDTKDLGVALLGVLAVFGSQLPGVDTDRVGRKLFAFAAFAHDMSESASITDPAARKDAQKTALRTLHRATTNRVGRGGEWVGSIGGTVGAEATIDHTGAPGSRGVLPIGFAVDRVRLDDAPFGWHFEAGVVDLGHAVDWSGGTVDVSSDTVQSTVRLSLLAGVTALRPNLPLVVGARATVDPGVGDAKPGFCAGLAIGFFVPLFDVN